MAFPMDLFTPADSLLALPFDDGELHWQSQLALPWSNPEVLARLIAETGWRAETIVIAGRACQQPRLTAWHGEAAYSYSGLQLAPQPFTALQQVLRSAVEAATRCHFNSVLLNYYRDGRDSMGMHSDDEAELGPEPAIASLSFGATRTFILRHKASKRTVKVDLPSGSLLLMAGRTQAAWQHGINKSSRPLGPRVNLTFRNIV